MVCPRCSEAQGIVQNGYSSSGAQLYRCKHCLKTFQLHYSYNGEPRNLSSHCDMAMNGSGYHDTASVLQISLNTVLSVI